MLELNPAYLDNLHASCAERPLVDVNLKLIILDWRLSKLKFNMFASLNMGSTSSKSFLKSPRLNKSNFIFFTRSIFSIGFKCLKYPMLQKKLSFEFSFIIK